MANAEGVSTLAPPYSLPAQCNPTANTAVDNRLAGVLGAGWRIVAADAKPTSAAATALIQRNDLEYYHSRASSHG